jgi:hypothetical protein
MMANVNPGKNHITKTISSHINIYANKQKIWENITNVQIEQFSHPAVFQVLGIPKPLKAEIVSEGAGGSRVAYFSNKKRFLQKILVWKPLTEYSFSFNPEQGFVVGYLFDISDGVFQIPTGSYYLSGDDCVLLKLETTYSIHKYLFLFFYIPVTIVLKLFQRFLLTSIKKNSER